MCRRNGTEHSLRYARRARPTAAYAVYPFNTYLPVMYNLLGVRARVSHYTELVNLAVVNNGGGSAENNKI